MKFAFEVVEIREAGLDPRAAALSPDENNPVPTSIVRLRAADPLHQSTCGDIVLAVPTANVAALVAQSDIVEQKIVDNKIQGVVTGSKPGTTATLTIGE